MEYYLYLMECLATSLVHTRKSINVWHIHPCSTNPRVQVNCELKVREKKWKKDAIKHSSCFYFCFLKWGIWFQYINIHWPCLIRSAPQPPPPFTPEHLLLSLPPVTSQPTGSKLAAGINENAVGYRGGRESREWHSHSPRVGSPATVSIISSSPCALRAPRARLFSPKQKCLKRQQTTLLTYRCFFWCSANTKTNRFVSIINLPGRLTLPKYKLVEHRVRCDSFRWVGPTTAHRLSTGSMPLRGRAIWRGSMSFSVLLKVRLSVRLFAIVAKIFSKVPFQMPPHLCVETNSTSPAYQGILRTLIPTGHGRLYLEKRVKTSTRMEMYTMKLWWWPKYF